MSGVFLESLSIEECISTTFTSERQLGHIGRSHIFHITIQRCLLKCSYKEV